MAASSKRPMAPLLSKKPSGESDTPLAATVTPASASSHPQSTPTFSAPSLVAKEWVIPPRPKPGRKPATDTPPSKRKAQNRAAQRAFRERRAAKVSDLEDQLDDVTKSHEGSLDSLKLQMATLEANLESRVQNAIMAHSQEAQQLSLAMLDWKDRCTRMEARLEEENRRRWQLEKELALHRGDAVPLPPRPSQSTADASRTRQQDSVVTDTLAPSNDVTSFGCGRCTPDSRCQCIEDVLKDVASDDMSGMGNAPKRSRGAASPAHELPSHKRLRTQDQQSDRGWDEVDYTSFGKPSTTASLISDQSTMAPPSAAMPMTESCGFCQGGGTCICAEISNDPERARINSDRLPSPPSDIFADNSVPATPTIASVSTAAMPSSANSGCSGNPGSCAQCRSSATSTLFCKSLAAARRQAPIPRSGDACVPGSKSANGQKETPSAPCALGAACCRNKNEDESVTAAQPVEATRPANSTSTRSKPSSSTQSAFKTTYGNTSVVLRPTLSCAEAFTTLSRHPAFQRATQDLGEWLPRLATKPNAMYEIASPATQKSSVASKAAESQSMPGATGSNSQQDVDSGAKSIADAMAAMGGRTAFEIEAASVMGVLKFFDRRFGTD